MRRRGARPIKTVMAPEWSVSSVREGLEIEGGQTSGVRAYERNGRRLARRGTAYEVSWRMLDAGMVTIEHMSEDGRVWKACSGGAQYRPDACRPFFEMLARRMLRLLVERGSSVDLADNHRDTALMAAVRAGSIESVNFLIAAGADLNVRDQAGRTALAWAARSRRTDVMDALRGNRLTA